MNMCYIYSITLYKNKIKNKASSIHFIVRTSIDSVHPILYLLIILSRVFGSCVLLKAKINSVNHNGNE